MFESTHLFSILALETGTTVNIPVCKDKPFNFLATFPKDVDTLTKNGTNIGPDLKKLNGKQHNRLPLLLWLKYLIFFCVTEYTVEINAKVPEANIKIKMVGDNKAEKTFKLVQGNGQFYKLH